MTFNFDKKLSFGLSLYGTSALVCALIYCAHAKSLETKAKNLNLAVDRLYKVTEKILEAPEDNNKKNK